MKIRNNRAVFLDRDGVINRSFIRNGKPYPPTSIDQVEILPGVQTIIADLKHNGFLTICVTNQPDVARGIQKKELIEDINKFLQIELKLDNIFTCYHDDKHNCNCRKPNPGMLIDAANLFSIDLEKSFMIGDRWRDIEAGFNAGCRTILIDYGYNEEKSKMPPDKTVRSLKEAGEWILSINRLSEI